MDNCRRNARTLKRRVYRSAVKVNALRGRDGLSGKDPLQHEENQHRKTGANRQCHQPGNNDIDQHPQIHRADPACQSYTKDRANGDVSRRYRNAIGRGEHYRGGCAKSGTVTPCGRQFGDLLPDGLHHPVTECGEAYHDAKAAHQ